MNLQFNNEVLNDIKLHTLKTDKFKTYTVVVNVVYDLTRETATKIALLPNVLIRGTRNYPTYKKIKERLDYLYGASLDVHVMKRGERHITQFVLEVANESFLKDNTPLLKEAISLLSEIITKPLIEENVFKQEYVESEKQSLKNRIRGILDDKIHYAQQKMIENMCQNEPYQIPANGYLESIDEINTQNLFEFYQKWLNEAPIDFFVVGNIDKDEVLSSIQEFGGLSRSIKTLSQNKVEVPVSKEKIIIDRLEVNQGKLNLGIRTNTTIKDDDYYSLLLYNGILGGFSHSKLFVNVREKESLAYYASSRLDSHKGLLIIQSGIEIQNFKKAVEIIKQQLQLMKQGQISDKELEQTKSVLINQMREITDLPRHLIDFSYHSVLSGRQRTIDDVIKGIHETTISDIVKVAQKIELDTIYFLRDFEKEES